MSSRVTSADVAAAAGVSRSTVSFVLNETPGQKISLEVRKRVREQASRLGYSPHPHALALVSGSSRIVLVTLPRWPVEYALQQVLAEASTVLDSAGYTLVTTDPEHAAAARPLWETLRPDIVVPLDTLPARYRSAIADRGIPVLDFDTARSDMAGAAAMQVFHLKQRGHRSLAFASTDIAGFEAMNDARRSAAIAACNEHSIQVTDAVVAHGRAPQIVTDWIAAGVTGVVAFNDDVAAIVTGGALRGGYAVPGDLAIIGHDDAPIASLYTPSLTSVRFDIPGLGHHLADLAIAAIRGFPTSIAEPPPMQATLIAREST